MMLQNGRIWLGGRLALRAVTAADGLLVSYWRNNARQHFFDHQVVTPDTHALWLADKGALDQVWLAEDVTLQVPVGMCGLKMGVDLTGEYGRTLIDPQRHGQGYATEMGYMALWLGFELFQLRNLWLELYAANTAALHLYLFLGWAHDNAVDERLWMTYQRATWAAQRKAVIERYGWQIPEWQP